MNRSHAVFHGAESPSVGPEAAANKCMCLVQVDRLCTRCSTLCGCLSILQHTIPCMFKSVVSSADCTIPANYASMSLSVDEPRCQAFCDHLQMCVRSLLSMSLAAIVSNTASANRNHITCPTSPLRGVPPVRPITVPPWHSPK